jgi:hypothetical protein
MFKLRLCEAEVMSRVELDRAEAPRASIAALAARAILTDADIDHLRRRVLRFGYVTRAEAEALFEIDAAPSQKPESWTALFVEALTDHIVWQSRPTGVVSHEQADWVLDRAAQAQTLTRLALLVNILAEAHAVPASFVATVRARAASWPDLHKIMSAA